MKYLGHIVENGTIRVDLDKVAVVQTWPMPTCVKEVQQFLGLANYYHEFLRILPNSPHLLVTFSHLRQLGGGENVSRALLTP